MEKEEEKKETLTPMELKAFVSKTIDSHPVVIFSKTYCPYCKKAKEAMSNAGISFHAVEIDIRGDTEALQDELKSVSGIRTVPQVFVKGEFIGDSSKTVTLAESGELSKLVGVAPSSSSLSPAGNGKEKENGAAKSGDVEMAELKQQDGRPAHGSPSMDVEDSASKEAPLLPPTHTFPQPLRWPFFWFPRVLNLNVARTSAALNCFLAIALGVTVISGEYWARPLTGMFFADFFLRVIFGGRATLVGCLGYIIATMAEHAGILKVTMTAGPPKQFAQMVGTFMTGVPTILVYLKNGDDSTLNYIAGAFLLVLAVFAGLEGFVNFCAGCWMFKMFFYLLGMEDPSKKYDSLQDEIKRSISYQRQKLNEGPRKTHIKYTGPHKVPYKYHEKTTDQKKEDFNVIKHTHIGIVAAPLMGLSGLALLFKITTKEVGIDGYSLFANAHEDSWIGITWFTAIVSGVLFLLYLVRTILYPQKTYKDFTHPAKANFFSGIPISIVIYSLVVENEDLAKVLFWIGSPLSLLHAVWMLSMWISRPLYRSFAFPVMLIAPVGTLVSAMGAMRVSKFSSNKVENLDEMAYLWFSTGIIMYIVLFTMTFQRMTFAPFAPDKMRVTTSIYMAAPAIASVAYNSVTDSSFVSPDAFALSLFYFSVIMAVVSAFTILKNYLPRAKFNPSYWAFVFPLESVALVCTLYYYGDQTNSFAFALARGFNYVSFYAFIQVFMMTLTLIVDRHDIFTPEPKVGPLSFNLVGVPSHSLSLPFSLFLSPFLSLSLLFSPSLPSLSLYMFLLLRLLSFHLTPFSLLSTLPHFSPPADESLRYA